jgi:hypothetical protein
MRLNEKNALVEICPRHYNRQLFAEPAGMREEGGSHPPPDSTACGYEHSTASSAGIEHGHATAGAAEDGHEFATAGENDRRDTR